MKPARWKISNIIEVLDALEPYTEGLEEIVRQLVALKALAKGSDPEFYWRLIGYEQGVAITLACGAVIPDGRHVDMHLFLTPGYAPPVKICIDRGNPVSPAEILSTAVSWTRVLTTGRLTIGDGSPVLDILEAAAPSVTVPTQPDTPEVVN